MASLRKIRYSSGGWAWVIEYRINKKSRRKTLGKVDKKTAKRIFHEFCLKLSKDDLTKFEPTKILLRDFIQEYLEYADIEKAPRTVERDRQILKHFERYFEDVFLEYFDAVTLEKYRINRLNYVSKETANLEFRHLKAIFNKALLFRYIKANPFTQIKALRIPESNVPRFFELEDISRIRKEFKGDPFEYIVEFFLLTGARRREVLHLNWDDIDFKRKQLILLSANTKGKKHRIISFEFEEKLNTLLKRIPRRTDGKVFGPSDDRPQWNPHWVSRKISRKMNKIGLSWASCHTFRHTYISHLVMAGVPLATVQQLVGHSDFKTTLRYAHLAPAHKYEMIAKRPY